QLRRRPVRRRRHRGRTPEADVAAHPAPEAGGAGGPAQAARAGAQAMTRATLLFALALAAPSQAWEAATTHAGLTEGAALQSRVGEVLAEAYGRPLALWEPLTIGLDPTEENRERAERIQARLAKLDPGGGYAPADGRLPAI